MGPSQSGYLAISLAAAPYMVDNTPEGFVVRVQNSGGAFLLGIARDNTLRGSGSTAVNGQLVSSIHGDNVSFTPHSETCGIGTFTARAERSTMRPRERSKSSR